VSSHLGIAPRLELVDNLKGLVSDVAAREEKLEKEFRGRFALVRHRRDEAVEEILKQLAQDTAQAESAFQAEKEKIQSHDAQRQARISRAHQALQQRIQQEIEGREGRGQYRVQSETLQSKRDHKGGLDAAEKAFVEFQGQLAETQGLIQHLDDTAQAAFKAYRKLFRRLVEKAQPPEPEAGADEYQLMTAMRESLEQARQDLARFRSRFLPQFFKHPLVWIFFLLAPLPLVEFNKRLELNLKLDYSQAGMAVGGLLVVGLLLYFLGKHKATPVGARLAGALAKARHWQEICRAKSETRHTQEIQRVEAEYAARIQRMEEEWNQTMAEVARLREVWPKQAAEKEAHASSRREAIARRKYEKAQAAHDAARARLQQAADARVKVLTDDAAEREGKLNTDYQGRWQVIETDWKTRIEPIYRQVRAAQTAAAQLTPPWDPPRWEHWEPPTEFAHAAQFAQLEVDVAKLAGAIPKDPRLALPGPAEFLLPLLLLYPEKGSILLETNQSGRDEALAALNNIILRLLSNSPPGRLNFTVVDPVGLGQSFAGVMHLADFEEHLINSRIWTQTTQIEQKLADLNEHMEKVIQMYLRNEYETIAEYNKQAGNIAEKYHFLVAADFPTGFSEIAAKRLVSIATSGARCGVFTLIHWDRRQPVPQDFVPEELRKSSICVSARAHDFILTGRYIEGARLRLDPPPTPEFAIEFVQKIGQRSIDSNRVEVPFNHVTPPDEEMWTGDTTSELKVPVGRTGATKLQYLAIGKDTRQHALVAGKTGSGKSTLFHVVITNLALWCSPEQVEFYLVDFKKGVEFKCYANRKLPHARVVAIESDREFGLSVLQRIDEELKRRGEMFRKLGVQDIPGYKRAGGTEAVPRTLLIIDEFQEFFVEDDKIAQTASVLLDRLVRQGRAFGIHIILGSQTLGGAYTVARTTLGQMVIRIALQCNEADAYLIMDDTNPAPRLLSRPGEGIYNDMAGALEGNSPFQVVWLPDPVRDACLAKVRAHADQSQKAYPPPIVYEGDAPADVAENDVLRAALEAPAAPRTLSPRIWLGAPNSIKGPTEAIFHRQSGNNLLIVGQREDAILAMLSLALISLSAQHPAGTVNFFLLDGTAPGTPQRDFIDRIVRVVPHPITVPRHGDLAGMLSGLAAELKRRTEDERGTEAPANFLLIHGLQKYNKLRHEEDFSFSADDAEKPANPAALLDALICEGTRLGFHTIITCDTYNNVNRALSRKAFSEFEMRILFQMSANDSASLIDSPKAGNLGLHRALFYNEQEGYTETFRPYALPTEPWLESTAQRLARLARPAP
jgi:DNA segregation ATPase FtsK/SpoIIIE, S-DNA-T family